MKYKIVCNYNSYGTPETFCFSQIFCSKKAAKKHMNKRKMEPTKERMVCAFLTDNRIHMGTNFTFSIEHEI